MLFNSLHFAVFFAVVFTLVAALRNRLVARNVVLLVAGYYFYAWWDWRFLGLLVFTTLFDFFCGRLLRVPGHVPDTPLVRSQRDKRFVAASMTVNLAILGFFKYYNFFTQSTADLLTGLGFHPNLTTLNIALPLGISFYTFQSMNYVIDVYRGELEAETSLLNFALFVSFFPHLVAGPILRATSLMPQIKSPSVLRWEKVKVGFYLFVWGLFKKAVIADNISDVSDHVFAAFPTTFASTATLPNGGMALIGIYAFAIQIYCDFSGYTDMARGVAKAIGFELMHNFDLPYFAVNPSDFWQRWHISLSSWLRDYLYIPLGGSRRGTVRTYVNLMLTMLLGGLWHGAAWTFVLWGGYHGALLCVYHGLRPWLKRTINPRGRATRLLWLVTRVVLYFQLTCLGWLVFRAASLQQAGLMLKAVATTVTKLGMEPSLVATFYACAAVLLVVQLAQAVTRQKLVAWLLPVPVRAVVYAAVFLGIVIFGGVGGRPFIYFAF